MGRILFAPFSIAGGLLAGLVASKIFEFIWSRFDEEEAPEPGHREVEPAKLTAALLVEGAIFRLVRGGFDRGARSLFYRGTHHWPGEERPEPV